MAGTDAPNCVRLTDGSGRSNQSRLASTTKVLNETGARIGSIYGRLTDSAAYAAILNHDFDLFVELANELSGAFAAERIDYVAGDAFEGYNPLHDVCRLIINAAVNATNRRHENHIANFEFSLIDRPGCSHELPHADGIRRILDEASFARKMKAAQEYAQLGGEVLAAIERTSSDAFRVECLCPVDPNGGDYSCEHPFYEQYGEKQVAAGYYDRVLRYNEHIAPLGEALKRLRCRSLLFRPIG
jgi:hypothetical protein